MGDEPSGEERQVRVTARVAIDGAPLAYVIVLAAVVTVLAFVPFSVILGAGSNFPMSQSIFALVGWILGPIAGAVASAIGRLVGVFLAPYTAGPVPAASVWGAAVAGLAAGCMGCDGRRRWWWIPVSLLMIVEFVLFVGRGVLVNGVKPGVAVLNSIVDWSAILLFVLPTRLLIARWIRSRNVGLVSAGLFLGTWMIAGLSHLSVTAILYQILNWPNEVWSVLIPIIPFEHLFRCLVGTVIGTGVIVGLRAIGAVKADWANY